MTKLFSATQSQATWSRAALLPLLILLIGSDNLSAQISFTAKDFVPPAYQSFGYGVNMGAYRGWTDEHLANIAAGNPAENVVGLEANSVRVWLPEWFTEEWGYDIRVDAFGHYERVGMKDNVVFVGDPSPDHKDTEMYCAARQSESFLNLYEPIWDNGANGTPVNEENYYAVYMYNLVLKYGESTKYWEITNEPDTDLGGHATLLPGQPNNWWENDPPPCETKFGAPIQHYVRTMRIAYEVVKSLQPEDYITTGGIGNKTFLDAILRNTDNPDGGAVTALYPHKGGAYFDCLSFHAYPHFDGSMRRWSDAEGGFVFTRNSDMGVEGFFKRMDGMVEVMENYGFDDDQFPRKTLICTESNLSRNAMLPEFLGDEESQKNYVAKLLVKAQANDVDQVHLYSLADHLPADQANTDFDFMGLFENLQDVPFGQEKMLDAGVAFKSVATILKDYEFDEDETNKLKLTKAIDGAAFTNPDGAQVYVLWAKTLKDKTEEADINYAFPRGFDFAELKRLEWDFSVTGQGTCVSKNEVLLTGSPIFLVPDDSPGFSCLFGFGVNVMPNPFKSKFVLKIKTDIDELVTIDLFDSRGVYIKNFETNRTVYIGEESINFEIEDLRSGIYYLRIKGVSSTRVVKIVKG